MSVASTQAIVSKLLVDVTELKAQSNFPSKNQGD